MTMIIEATTPEAQAEIIPKLSERSATGSRAGEMKEDLAVLVKSPDPRERYLFRDGYNLAFQLQEHWAYWEGANPGHVERYNSNMQTWIDEDTGKLPGSAYGDRMRNTAGHDQIARAVEQLREGPETRRAMIMVHQPHVEDYDSNDVACTAYLHPFLRDGKLHMIATIRSQDMFWGYPYDTANNQWIQEVMAGMLGAELGEYWHMMDSCHYYTEFEERALDAAESGTPVSGREALLADDTFELAWDRLRVGLDDARRGEISFDALDKLPGLYRDWLGIMTAYEQYRFHGDEEKADAVAREYVGNADWQDWMARRVDP